MKLDKENDAISKKSLILEIKKLIFPDLENKH